MKLFDRILRSVRWRLWRTDTGCMLWGWIKCFFRTFFPYNPPYLELPEERTRSFFASECRPSSIPGAGLGLFALEDVPAGVTLGEYCGDPVTSTLKTIRLRNSDHLVYTDNPSLYLCAFAHPEVKMRWVNHHPDPQAVNVDIYTKGEQVFFETTRPIPSGSEFFTDYGPVFWKIRGTIPSAG